VRLEGERVEVGEEAVAQPEGGAGGGGHRRPSVQLLGGLHEARNDGVQNCLRGFGWSIGNGSIGKNAPTHAENRAQNLGWMASVKLPEALENGAQCKTRNERRKAPATTVHKNAARCTSPKLDVLRRSRNKVRRRAPPVLGQGVNSLHQVWNAERTSEGFPSACFIAYFMLRTQATESLISLISLPIPCKF
jgi:hypothetical protein